MYQVKFTGIAEIPFPLDRDKNYNFIGELEEISRTETDQKDGTIVTSYKMAPIRIALEEGGERIHLKTKNSNSQRIRAAVYRAQQERHPTFVTQDSGEYYDTFTNKLVHPETLQSILDLLEL
jgi:hypothetical protein